MTSYPQTSREVEEIGNIDFTQNSIFVPHNWYHNLRRSNGKPYIEAVIILAHLKQLSIEANGNQFRCSYEFIANHFSLTKDQARNAVKYLEASNLLSTSLNTIGREGNVLFIEVNESRVLEITNTQNLLDRQVSNPYGRPTSIEWENLKSQVFRRDSYTCVYCYRTDRKLHCDHVLPISRGGSNDLSNLATACEFCNTSKGSKTIEEWGKK